MNARVLSAVPPSSRLVPRLDELAAWRARLGADLAALRNHLEDADLLSAEQMAGCDALRERLASDPLVLVCVAEFSAGKSELLNALLFGDLGCRMLPAAPGATTLCPMELGWDARQPAQLALLPIETHAEPLSLVQWRERPEAWQRLPLDTSQPVAMAEALAAVTETRSVTRDQARAWGVLGAQDDVGPAQHGHDRVAVPRWRHALVNVPHPLLASGLVVVDTPGLGAPDSEPGATLGLLATAAAVFFVVDASRGVSRSDLGVWHTHLDDPALSRFVVLTKTDLLADPLSTPQQQQEAQQLQRAQVAQTLGLPTAQVHAVSARAALLAGLTPGSAERQQRLAASGVPELKAALIAQLLPQRERLLELAVASFTQSLQGQLTRRVRELRRAHAQQMLELRALESKTSGRADQIGDKLAREQADFARQSDQIMTLRVRHDEQLHSLLQPLGDSLWRGVDEQLTAMLARPWYLPLSAASYAQMFDELQRQVDALDTGLLAMGERLALEFDRLQQQGEPAGEPPAPPELARLRADLRQIQRRYAHYFGVRHMARMTVPQFVEQFRRMLVSRMRSVFDNVLHQVRQWGRTALEPLELPLAQRETYLKRRRDALARADGARSDLLASLTELVRQDEALLAQAELGQRLAAQLRAAAQQGPQGLRALSDTVQGEAA